MTMTMMKKTINRFPHLIHYGCTVYNSSLVRKIQNRDFRNKPFGGLWTSPVNSQYGWKEWCLSENFREYREENSFNLKIHSEARICRINTLDDFIKLPKVEYGDDYGFFSGIHLNFEYLATEYDAIWLTTNGERETRHSYPADLYGWDCESVLVMNPDCVTQIKPRIKNGKKQQPSLCSI